MKFNEAFSTTKGVFYFFQQLFPEGYKKFFGEIETTDFDNWVFYNYGQKTVAPIIEENNPNFEPVFRLVINMHMQSWLKDYKAMFKDYDFTLNYLETETRTGTENTIVETDGKNTFNNKGFNSSDFVGKEQTITDDSQNSTLTLNTVYKKEGNTGNFSLSELLQKELEVNRSTFFNICITDIINDITLSIYESED